MTTPRRPPGRYDEPHRHPRWLSALVGAVLVVGLGALSFAAWQRTASTRTPVTLEGYRVLDDTSVEIRFEVHKDAADSVVCALRALDLQRAVVGQQDVTVGPGEKHVRHRLTTSRRAVLGEVTGCSAP